MVVELAEKVVVEVAAVAVVVVAVEGEEVVADHLLTVAYN